MSEIPDFNNAELDVIKKTVAERFGETIPLELAEPTRKCARIKAQPNSPQARDCHFVIIKTGEHRYQNQFFYRGYQ
ncbi:MAG: hypothetical protein LJE85_16135 [Gammaproteobacteria bacterium]|nr:hypothetical protein [Gammaproteobacteria bacterium]